MSDRTKSVLLLVVTLVLGMVLGSLITGTVINRRIDSLAEARGRMAAFFLRAIEPESEEQAEAIKAVLETAAPRFREILDSSREEMRRLGDSLMAELDPILSDEQKERLQERIRMGPRPPFDRLRRSGPREGGPGLGPGRHGLPGDSGRPRRRRPPPASDDSAAAATHQDSSAP